MIYNLAAAGNSDFLDALALQMRHVPWEGFHFFDLIMPLFMFMVGMSIPFSIDKRLSMGESKRKIYLHAFRRLIILLILGMAYDGNLLALDTNKLPMIHNMSNPRKASNDSRRAGFLIVSVICLPIEPV